MSRAREEIGYTTRKAEKDEEATASKVKFKKASIPDRIVDLLKRTSPRWWSPHEISRYLDARSAPRRLREIMEFDRRQAPHLREYEEKSVDNVATGEHKVYRWKGIQSHPTLF